MSTVSRDEVVIGHPQLPGLVTLSLFLHDTSFAVITHTVIVNADTSSGACSVSSVENASLVQCRKHHFKRSGVMKLLVAPEIDIVVMNNT